MVPNTLIRVFVTIELTKTFPISICAHRVSNLLCCNLFYIQLIRYSPHSFIDHYNIIMVDHVFCVFHIHLDNLFINIGEIGVLIKLCLFMTSHGLLVD